jgi:hypothetical protein
MRRRVFSKATGDMTTSIRLSSEMFGVIEKLAEEQGETRNAYIVLALDEYLQMKAEAGEIPWPKGYDPKANLKKK